MEKYAKSSSSTSRNNDKKLSTGSKPISKKEIKEKVEPKPEIKTDIRQDLAETASPHVSNPSTPRNNNQNSVSVNFSSPGGSGNPLNIQEIPGREKSDSHNLSFEQQNLLNISNESSNISQEANVKDRNKSSKKDSSSSIRMNNAFRPISSSNKTPASSLQKNGAILNKASSIPASTSTLQKNDKPGRLGSVNSTLSNPSAVTNGINQGLQKCESGLLDIASFYKKERGMINTWTYFFKSLNSAITDIYTMCDLENKKEYCDGVIATLENSLNHFNKLRHKFDVETQFVNNQKSVAWELSSYNLNNSSDLQNTAEMENFIEDLEDAENVDFTLLTQLINDGKMTFYEAIVFLIRERALAIEENSGSLQGGGFTNCIPSNNNSFISKYSSEFLEAIREFKDDSNLVDSNSHNEKEISKRSRSVTPTSLSLVRIIKRLNWRLAKKLEIKEEEDEVDETNKEKLFWSKQQKAEILRKSHEESKRDFVHKIQKRLKLAKERLEEKKRHQLIIAINKRDLADQRYVARIKEIKQRAKEESNKANEIAFITMLDNQDKKLTLDEKLKEVCERKLQIIETIKQKQNVKALVRGEAVEKRKQEKIKAQQEKNKSYQQRHEEAEMRRTKILEVKRKQQLESKKDKYCTEKKKSFTNITKRLDNLKGDGNEKKPLDRRPYEQKLAKLKQRFLKEKERMDKIFDLISANSNSKNQACDFNEASSFKTIKTTDSESIVSDDEEERPNLKMNSVDNSIDYDFMVDGDFTTENSIIYENNPNTRMKEERLSSQNIEALSKNSTGKFAKKRKKPKGNAKDRKGSGNQLVVEEKKFTEKRKRFLDLPSSSLPILRYQSSLCLLKAKGSRKVVKNLYVKLRRKFKLKKQKKSISSSQTKEVLKENDVFNDQPIQSRKNSEQVEYKENTEPVSSQESNKNVEQFKIIDNSSNVSKVSDQKPQPSSDKEKSQKKNEMKKAPSKLANPSFGFIKGSKASKLGAGMSSSSSSSKPTGPASNANEVTERKESILIEEPEGKLEEARLISIEKEGAGAVSEKEGDSFVIKWCSICNLILIDETTSEEHLGSKMHKKIKSLYSLTINDDLNCILTFQSGDPENEDLKNQRLNAFRKRCKKIKQRLAVTSLKHEAASLAGKETSSPNKQRLQKLCVELEKQISPQIKDYNQVENTLRDLIKILEVRRESDLHIMRHLKFLPVMMEICKRVTVCHKNDINSLMRVWELTIKVLLLFCGLTDNRTYMITTNRILPLIDLLTWCLNRPTKYVYSLGFVPNLFQLLTIHLKHRLSTEFSVLREDVIEYIFCSGFILKLKQKFMSFDGGLDLSTAMGKVPLALLKSVTFLETLTGYSGFDFRDKPVYEKSSVSESILFVIKETELVGVIPLLASLLLSDPSYNKPPFKTLPQTVLTLGIICLKFLNNMAQLDLEILQRVLNAKHNEDIVFHIFSFLLSYSSEHFGENEDVEDLLNEALLLVGNYCLLNTTSQNLLSRGEQTLVQKLSGLPFNYFCDKKKLQECLFPTLVCVVFKNERNLKILLQEIDPSLLTSFIVAQIALYPYSKKGEPSQVESATKTETAKDSSCEPVQQEIAEVNKNSEEKESCAQTEEQKAQETVGVYSNYLNLVKESREKKGRSLSISSTTSSQKSFIGTQPQNFKFIMRFPRELWEEAMQYLKT